MSKPNHQSLPPLIRSALGLPEGTDHTATIQTGEASGLYVVRNARGVAYLLCVILDGAAEPFDDRFLRETLSTFETVGVALVLAQDGSQFSLIRKSFRTGDFDYIARLDNSTIISPGFVFSRDGAASGRALRPLTHRLENVLFEVHSAFRDVDGLHAPDALDEICKLLYAKLYDEENGGQGKAYAFQRTVYSSTEECAAEIRRLYHVAIENDRAIFANKIPGYDRSRGVFRDALMLSSAAIVRAVEILQQFDLGFIPLTQV